MNIDVRHAIEASGVELVNPVPNVTKVAKAFELVMGRCKIEPSAGNRVGAIPVAEVKNQEGRVGVAYWWNTGEVEFGWSSS
jgi:hypothetical protein